jgi:hypothetical protein
VGFTGRKDVLLKMKTSTVRLLCLAITLTLAVSSLVTVSGTEPVAKDARLPFEPREELVFIAEFSRSVLRKLDVAEFKLSSSRTQSDPKNKVDTLTLKADVTSKGFFTRLFNLKFREQVESTVDPATFTIRKTTILDEQGKRVRATETVFDREKGKMTWTLRDPNNPSSEPRTAVADFSGQLQDILSAIYFLRTVPLEVGKSFNIYIGDGGRIYNVPVKVLEKKKMKTVLGKVDVVLIEPDLFGPDKLIDTEKGSFTIWLTADNRRIPVSSHIKTDYGSFDVKLKKVTNPS